MEHKILLLDFDGVLSPGKLFSDVYAEEFGIDPQVMQPFFRDMKVSANIGEADVKELLKDVLATWEWKGTVDELVDYWLKADTDLDEELIKAVKELKDKGLKVYLVSDQEKYRADYIWNNKGLKDWMDGKFISCEIGFIKDSPEFFQYVINELKIPPTEILYFDDSESKVASAKEVGIDAYLYTDLPTFYKQIKSLFPQ